MIKLIILLIFFVLIISLLVFIVKKVAKLAIFVGIVILVLIVVGSVVNLDFRSIVKDKTTEVVGMAVGKVEGKSVDYVKENLNISGIKDTIVEEIKD